MNAKMMLKVLLIMALTLFVCVACDKASDEKAEAVTTAEKTPEPAKESPEGTKNAAPDAAVKAAMTPKTYAGSHILIAYKGAMRAAPTVTKTKEEALKLATDLAGQLAKDGSKFEVLAKANSDCPSKASGGDLGSWQKGMMVKEFDAAIDKLANPGDITKTPIETPFGFHVIRRNKTLPQVEVAAKQIMIQFKGSLGSDPKITRSKEEANARAKEAATKIKANVNDFEKIAKTYNDAPTDSLPIWTTGGRMPREFDKAVLGMEIGQISEPVESPFGYHVFKRIEVVHQPEISGSHILIQYKGAKGTKETVTRTKEEAKKLAQEVLKKAKADPSKFAELAMKHSEDPSAAMNQGNMGVWEQGEMIPEFDQAISKLKIGEVGGPVETPIGFHILKRNEIKKEVKMQMTP